MDNFSHQWSNWEELQQNITLILKTGHVSFPLFICFLRICLNGLLYVYMLVYSLSLHSVLKAFSLFGQWPLVGNQFKMFVWRCMRSQIFRLVWKCILGSQQHLFTPKSLMWQGPNILPTTNSEKVARWCGMLQAKNCSCWLSPTHQGLFSLIKPQVLTNFDSNWNTNCCLHFQELNIFMPMPTVGVSKGWRVSLTLFRPF